MRSDATPESGRPAIEAVDLRRSLPLGGQVIHILQGVSFTVRRGEWVALTGPSGSGKSTLLGIVSGLDTPSSGRIVLDGIDVTAMPERDLAKVRNTKVGVVFQSFNLIPTLTAQENVEAPLYVRPFAKRAREAAREMLDLVGLDDRRHHLPHQLSGGQQQRVAIARALVTRPAVLVADEPTGNLDSAIGAQVLDLFARVREEIGVTLFVVTHDPDVSSRADRRLHLVDGRLSEGMARPGGRMNARFLLTYAFKALRRGGRRTLLAALCVAFGALALVSLQLLASSILGVIDVDPRLILGGDASVHRAEGPLVAADLEELDRLRADGSIERYTATARVPARALKVVRSGRVYSVRRVLGVSPGEFPLLARFALDGPDDFAASLRGAGHAVITRDLAAVLDVGLGDEFLLAGIPDRAPSTVVVAGIATWAPDRRGDSIYVSLETARSLIGRDDVATQAAVLGARAVADVIAYRPGGSWIKRTPSLRAGRPSSICSG